MSSVPTDPIPAPHPTATPDPDAPITVDEECYKHASKCYSGPAAEAIRNGAQEPELLKYFTKVPAGPLQPGDVVVWPSKHTALAIGQSDLVFQNGVTPQHLDEFVRYRALQNRRRADTFTDAERVELKKFESTEFDASVFHSESIATANDLATRGGFGDYTAYRIKPEFSHHYSCAQLSRLARQRPKLATDPNNPKREHLGGKCWCTKTHDPHLAQDFDDTNPHICWCGTWHRYRGRHP